ncbi:MAG: type II toxin-antitoxin system VapC family toxin [Limisphaerales bacterium]
MTLADSNVLLDVLQEDPHWGEWSRRRLADAFDRGVVIINPIIFAEVALAFDSQEELEAHFRPEEYERRPLPWTAATLVAKAFLRYRRGGGARMTPLPDFYIGAQAEVEKLKLLTRDPTRYRTYFPKVQLITPD